MISLKTWWTEREFKFIKLFTLVNRNQIEYGMPIQYGGDNANYPLPYSCLCITNLFRILNLLTAKLGRYWDKCDAHTR